MSIREALLIGAGGACGALARHFVSQSMTSCFGERFPWGTLLVNVVGCFLLGAMSQFATETDTTKLLLGTAS